MGDWTLRHDDSEPEWPHDADLDVDELLDADVFADAWECPRCRAETQLPNALCGSCALCVVCGAVKARWSLCDCERSD